MATPVRFGTEFLINTNTRLDQDESAITGLADGRFIVTWTDDSAIAGDTSESAIRAQIYNADGSQAGPEFVLNSTTLGTQRQPAITELADGRFVASWVDYGTIGLIRAQVFNANGAKSGAEILVSNTTGGAQVHTDITGLASGRFVVTWTDPNADTGRSETYSQVFNVNGNKVGTAQFVHQTLGNHYSSAVTALTDGRYVVTWTDTDTLGKTEVKARIFDAGGSPAGNEFIVNTRLPDDQDEPDIAALKGGRFVAVWVDNFEGNNEIRAQLFNATGAKSGLEIVVNTTGAGFQVDPAITSLADGRFVVTWTDNSNTGGDTSGFSAIRGQLFDADGSPSGAEFLVNTTTTNIQYQPSITSLADGRFVISWSDFSGTGADTNSGYAVRGQIFDPREKAVNLTGTSLADQWVGTRFNDKMSGAGRNDLLKGENGADNLNGGNGNDRLLGGVGADLINGGKNNDVLLGGSGADKLIGGLGRDKMSGETGADDFIFTSATFAGTGASRDVIADFEHRVDDIDLGGFMAGGEFIGNSAFEDVAGQVRYNKATGILQGDVNGDGNADFEIGFTNKPVLSAADFIL